jgi:hypothetical protein
VSIPSDLIAFPARGKMPRHFQASNRLKMKAFGNRVFESRAAKSQGGLFSAYP